AVSPVVNPEVVQQFRDEGFAIARGLFPQEEVDHFATYFTDMVERGGDGWAEGVVDRNHPDPLKRYPRLLQPHRGDPVAFGFMIDPRINAYLTAMAGAEPLAVQTMVYFKPPGARGQNLHQDNMYLLTEPGTCMAAWMALDDIDEENGCMVLAPGTKDLPIICQVETPGLSVDQWGDIETPLPPGAQPIPAVMKRGDVLFFNGSVIHGSFKNKSRNRFRRSLIGHYIAGDARQVAKYYFPVFRMDGSTLEEGIEESAPSGPCGVYSELGVELAGQFKTWEAAH
ncbi:MAG TPA: phytanoyl-CoA dioxygenase family protein, partial [Fimbriimonas sp.]|nr:phytanoyl-CoA dioxygenase family protein [Fimbriimonas sp.]